MAKKTALSVTSGFASQAQLNAEFEDIADHLNNKVLYRDNPAGEDNAMQNDIDMNSNQINNLSDATNVNDAPNWGQVQNKIAAAGSGLISSDSEQQTATASQTVFTLTGISYTPGVGNLAVYINGVRQFIGTSYAETSSTVVTFSEGLQVGDVVQFITNESTETSQTVIADTRTATNKAGALAITPVAGLVVHVLSADGGLFKAVTGAAPATYSDNGGSYCGTQFIPTGGDGSAAWVRVDGGYNVGLGYQPEWFGAAGDGTTDDTTAIDNTSEYVKGIGGGLVQFGAVTYRATKIVRKDFVSMKGHGRGTELIALTSAETGFIQIEAGPVRFSHLDGLTIFGSTTTTPINAGQWGIYSEAVDSGGSGGDWWATVKNIRIARFDNTIWFKGGATGSNLPHQFTTLIGVYADRASSTGNTLKMTGMVNQVRFYGGQLDGVTPLATKAGTNILIQKDTTNAPANCTFNGITSQNAEKVAVVTDADGVVFTEGWFENIDKAFSFSSAAHGCGVKDSHFANAASDGSGTGYAIEVANTASAFFINNNLKGDVDKIISASTSPRGIVTYGNISNTPITAISAGVTQQISESAGVLTVNGGHTFLINTSATNITTITSDDHLPGAIITLEAHSGSIKLATGGNIDIAGATSPITIPQYGIITLVRHDLAGTWKVLGTAPSAAVADLNQTITGPSIAEVQAISDKVDELLAALRLAGNMQ